MPILASALANKGINFTYTTKTTDLNSDYLSNFDALMIYANHDSITIDQESALLDYVAGGKGFLPIHCASWCFRNSAEYIELVGAQFKSHGTGIFKAEVVNTGHPVTHGYQSFESWDETYVSDMHNQDRTSYLRNPRNSPPDSLGPSQGRCIRQSRCHREACTSTAAGASGTYARRR